MAEEINEEQQEIEDPVQQQSAPNTQKKSYGGLIFGCINLFLILLLAGAGFYLLQETKDKQLAQGNKINKFDSRDDEVDKRFDVYQSQIATMQSQIATFGEEITGKDNHFTSTLAEYSQLHSEKLENTHNKIMTEVSQLKRQLGKTRGDWLMADAEYLLSVANQRLHLMGDVNTTRIALEAADQRLRESGDTAAFKVREQIAKEIAGLSAIVLPDVVGIYSSIQLLKDKVKSLAVLLPYAGKPLTESKQVHDHDNVQDSDHGILNSALHLLEGYVTVKHSDQPVTKIITEEEVGFIRQQLNVKLEMIKITLVQQNDEMFKSSIADTKQWLNSNFTKNTHSSSFMQTLDKLDNIQLSSQFPDVSRSLKMLKDISKLRIESDKAQLIPMTPKKISTEIVLKDKLVADTIVKDKPVVDGFVIDRAEP